jgi:hypothetical protein
LNEYIKDIKYDCRLGASWNLNQEQHHRDYE